MSQEKWAGFDRQWPISLKGAGIQNSWRSMTPPKNEKVGHTSSTLLNSCSYQRYRLSFRNLYSILLLQTLLLNIQTCLAVLVWNWNMNWLDVISLMIIKIIQISEKCSSRFWCFLSFQVPVIFFVAELKIGRKSRKIHQI